MAITPKAVRIGGHGKGSVGRRQDPSAVLAIAAGVAAARWIAERIGASQQDRATALFRGGLRLYTAYDPYAQLGAQKAIDEVLPKSDFTASLG